MSKQLGRKAVLSRGGNPVGATRTKSVAIGNTVVDFTDDSSDGWAKHADEAGRREVTISGSGLFSDFTLATKAVSSNINDTWTWVDDDGNTITGTFGLTSFTINGEHEDALLAEFELQSSGVVTVTPGS